MKNLLLAAVASLALAGVASAQEPGSVFGRVTDSSNLALPGVTVTLTSPALLQPQVAVTSATGSYQFPGLGIGTYTVRFDMVGFGSLQREQIRITSGFNAQIDAALDIAGISEELTVIAQAPLIDTRSTTQAMVLQREDLDALPTIRDHYSLVAQAPSLLADRQNVGGTTTGNETASISRGSTFRQNKWTIDGVDITDSNQGQAYYVNANNFEEVKISTGGADASIATPGTNVNMIAKSGSDQLRGSFSTHVTGQNLAWTNLTQELREEGSTAGKPVKSVQEYHIDVGGPISRGRAWFWGSARYGFSERGAPNVWDRSRAECAPVAADPLAHSVRDAVDCLFTNRADFRNYAYRFDVTAFEGNRFTLYNGYDINMEKVRGANDLRPVVTTNGNGGLFDTRYGPRFWTTGYPPTWRFTDQHVFSDRLMAEASFTRFGKSNHFVRQDQLGNSSEPLAEIQPWFEISSGHQGRSFLSEAAHLRPNTGMNGSITYFRPGWVGGDHSFKIGFTYASNYVFQHVQCGTCVTARFNSGAGDPFTTPFSARMHQGFERHQQKYGQSLYIQDTISSGRLTLSLGLRYDRQHDEIKPSTAPSHPMTGETTMNGATFNFLPERSFPGAEGGVTYNNIAPRLGFTYDLSGDARTVVKAFYGLYYEQTAPAGALANAYNTLGNISVDFPWMDLNGDGSVQANEIDTSRVLGTGGNYNPDNPTQVATTPNTVDPDIQNPRTQEVVVGVSHQLTNNLSVSLNGIWRHYDRFIYQQRNGVTSADYSPVTFTPDAANCPVAGARCETVTYFVPNFPLPAGYTLTNQPDFYQRYYGIEASVTKRMADRWMMNASFSYNDQPVFYDSPAAYQDPTNISQLHTGQHAPESTASGNSNVFLSAKWLFRVGAAYRTAWQDIGFALSMDTRQGYPFLQSVNIGSRPNRAGGVEVLLDRQGDNRLPNFNTVDIKIDKSFNLGRVTLAPAIDMFNVFNDSTILNQRGIQNAGNANFVSEIVGPRIIRFLVTASF